jgi:flagella basal body P-ring formation protein FlgA
MLQERDITNMSDDIVTVIPADDVIAGVTVPEGMVLRQNCLTTPFAICSGDPVIVIVKSGKVSISEKGTAQSNGRKGDKIAIKLTGADRVVKAMVVEPGVAEIALGARSQR